MKKSLVLLVEDNSMHISLLQFILRDICELEYCYSPEECINQFFLENDYDLILMDIGFQGSVMNGIDLSKKIKSMERYKDIPIVAITAFIFGDIMNEINKAKDDGIFKEIISKPVENINSFRNKIKSYLE